MNKLIAWMSRLVLAALVVTAPALARAEDDPPGRVGRIADLQGSVSWFDGERGEWTAAQRNRPLTGGDRLSTDGDARAEVRIGSTTLRLDGGTELEFLRLDDDRIKVELHAGALALHVREREVANEVEVVTREARLRPLRSGLFRIDRIDDSTYAAALRGDLRVEDNDDPFTVDTGRRAELWREGRQLRRAWTRVPDDAFGEWVAREDRRDERSVSSRYVSPEMTGAEDLDRNGRWEQHPEYGAIWYPVAVPVGWAPYRYGHWAWVRPWGWTWVDDAPWGFAPFHYGRWVYWQDRWCWTPGAYVARPVYAPALVAWVGGAHFSVGVTVGSPSVGWVPLAPREAFVPYYRATPRYVDVVNRVLPGGRPLPPPRPNEPIMYGNQGVPNAVTVVPRDVLVNRQPVARAVIDLRDRPQRQPLPVLRQGPEIAAPPPAPAADVRPVPPPPRRAPVVRPPSVRDDVRGAEPAAPGRELPDRVNRRRDDEGRPAGRFDDARQPRPEAAPQRPGIVDLRRDRPQPQPPAQGQPQPGQPQPAQEPPRVQPSPQTPPQPQRAAPQPPVQVQPQPAPAQPPRAEPPRPEPPRVQREAPREAPREVRESREQRGFNAERGRNEENRENNRGGPRQQPN